MFEKFNGTPLFLIRILTMQRTEYQVDGPLTSDRPLRIGYRGSPDDAYRLMTAGVARRAPAPTT